MGEGGGLVGSAELSTKRALQIVTTAKCVLAISPYEKRLAACSRPPGLTAARPAVSPALCSAGWRSLTRECSSLQPQTTSESLRPSRSARAGSHPSSSTGRVATIDPRSSRSICARVGAIPRSPSWTCSRPAPRGYSAAEIESAVKTAVLEAFEDVQRALRTAVTRDLCQTCVSGADRVRPAGVRARYRPVCTLGRGKRKALSLCHQRDSVD